MTQRPLTDREVDALLRRELPAPIPSSDWRERVRRGTLGAAPMFNAAARQAELDALRARSRQGLAQARRALLQSVSPYLLITAAALAVVPTLVERLQPLFGAVPGLHVSGLTLVVAPIALAFSIHTAFPRAFRALVGL